MDTMLSFIDAKETEMLALLETIVNIDSGTHDKVGVDRVGNILVRHLERLGFSVERASQAEYGDHLVARKPGGRGKRILFVGHMDTVFPTGTAARRPFRLEDGKAHGPGVLDMKGGLVSLLYALEALKEENTTAFDKMDMVAVLNSDEEVLSPTSNPIIEREARQAQTACVFEPARPGGEYVIARKGVGRYRMTVLGRAAHAGSQPEMGRNAVADLAHKIVAMHELGDASRGTTLSVNVVHGGERPNVIAEHAYAEMDLRVTSLDEASRVEATMREIAATSWVPDVTAELSGGLLFPPMQQSPVSSLLFALLRDVGERIGVEVDGIATGGGSDGNNTSQFTPTLDGMGPVGNGSHSDREHIEIPSLIERTKMTALFLSAWPKAIETALGHTPRLP